MLCYCNKNPNTYKEVVVLDLLVLLCHSQYIYLAQEVMSNKQQRGIYQSVYRAH